MRFRFGPFGLDSRTRQLLRDGGEVALSPKAFHLLLLLVENHARAMSRDELQQQLWPSTFVLDTNLAGLVAEVRRALGDTADRATFVRTMHRFGYRFIADVHVSGEPPAPEQQSTRCWLVWEARQVALQEGDNLVGRGVDAAVWIDAPGVSRHHARIVVRSGEATVADLGSKNGTYVGGHRVTVPHRLINGDQIRCGSVVITFRVPQPPGVTETAP
ncbi:MAG TPA: FHA domain-containing protein [Vicinamibacterales bacterium]|nr:FHA domain-containing protein [Vicinamibacterales bacterium]